MAKSILQTEKKCFITGSTYNLHEHHIFFGSGKRKLSEKYGLKIWLRADWHNMADYAVHFNKELDRNIKATAQKEAMKHYGWSVGEFISKFGKSYI